MLSRRDIALGAVALLVAMAAAMLWLRQTPPTPGPRQVAEAPAVEPTEDAPAAPTRSPERATLRELKQRREPSNVERATRLRRRAKFPPTSRPVDDGLDPIADERVAEIGRSGDRDEPGQHLIISTTDTTIQAPASVLIRARVVELDPTQVVEDGDIPEVAQPVRSIRAELRTEDGATAAVLDLNDDGENGDAIPGDRQFAASFTPDPDRPDDFRGRITVAATAETTAGEQRVATMGFFYAHPGAHLTGQYRDAIVDGHLQIEAEVAVETPGTYRLEGTLASDDAVLLGYARNEQDLEVGTIWVPMTFWGLILREHNENGPYTLFSVTLSGYEGDVAIPSDVFGSPYRTEAYDVTSFSDRSFDNPELLEAAERLESAGQGG